MESNVLCVIDWGVFTNIALAFIAGYVALRQVKGNIISGERIRWIEDLRELLSDFMTILNELKMKLEDLKTKMRIWGLENHGKLPSMPEAEKFINPVQIESRNLNKLKHKIMLYLSNGSEHKVLRMLIQDLYKTTDIEIVDLNNTNFDKIQKK